ncbi:MAG: hypothetical protein K2P81_03570 [Bacteriovoracaceae bacterium]|nr:hypothetical protein [Bacteriovoracaceae bacterium]
MKLTLFFVFSLFVTGFEYPKDTTRFPYIGKKADFLVGALGGTGCSRHWDILDTHDSSHHEPYDRCGKFSVVSEEFHKVVDMSQYSSTQFKVFAWPIRGDGVFEKVECDGELKDDAFRLVQYAECGGKKVILEYCRRNGEIIPSDKLKTCKI